MPRISPDANDQLVWFLNEQSGPYLNTGTLGASSAYQGNITNIINRAGLGIFDKCPWFPGTSNVPTGGAATKNTISGANTYNPQPPLSVSGWVFLRSYTSGYTHLITKAYRDPTITGTWAAPYFAVEMTVTPGNNNTDLYFGFAQNSSSQIGFTVSDFPIPLGQWTHIGVTHDGTFIRAYLNGCQLIYYSGSTQVNKTSIGSTISYTDGTNGFGPWMLGAEQASGVGKEEPNYLVQDVRIANVVRPLSYFQNIYSQGMLAFGTTNQVVYYKLRAYDTGGGLITPVTWVDTQISLTNAPSPPHGGPYVNLELLDQWVQ